MFGCIADDFTGASDAASFLIAGGLKTILYNGIPQKDERVAPDVNAVVIALKTRTSQTSQAVAESLEAAKWLTNHEVKQLYIKYCSTFDSNRDGNIGPVCDAILETSAGKYSILCPSLPVNKRTVKDGILYVAGVPLEQSHMRNHPLTPMWDSFIPNLMKGQSKYPCYILDRVDMDHTFPEKTIHNYASSNDHFYIVPDYEDERDAQMIVKHFGHLPVLTGGSGILEELGRKLSTRIEKAPVMTGVSGKAIILAGSCSPATKGQIEYYKNSGGVSFRIAGESLTSPLKATDSIWDGIVKADSGAALVYTAGNEHKTEIARTNHEEAAIIEEILAGVAVRAAAAEYTRIIVAGGETSGAVTQALNYHSYYIGKSIAPGVPMMQPLREPHIRLVLKSGNFGQEDFFIRALDETGENRDGH